MRYLSVLGLLLLTSCTFENPDRWMPTPQPDLPSPSPTVQATPPPLSSPLPIPTPWAQITPSPCAGDGCPVAPNPLQLQKVEPEGACAGDTLQVELTYRDAELQPQVGLILVEQPPRPDRPGEKGYPPAFGIGEVELLKTTFKSDKSARLSVKLESTYLTPQGKTLTLQQGQTNALLYLKIGNGFYYSVFDTGLCQAKPQA